MGGIRFYTNYFEVSTIYIYHSNKFDFLKIEKKNTFQDSNFIKKPLIIKELEDWKYKVNANV